MKIYQIIYLTIFISILLSCGIKTEKNTDVTTTIDISDDSLLNLVQYQTFQYFWENAEPTSGMAPERTHMDNDYPENDKEIITSGGSGFGLMAIIVGVERNFITRQEAIERFEKILNFLENADKFHGVYPHWWYGTSGKVRPFSEKDNGGDLVETSFLMQGLICVRQYMNENDQREKAIIDRINTIWQNVEWSWYTQNKDVLYWHWSPNFKWEINHAIRGYNECLITYILAASSPTYPIKPSVYHKGWAKNGEIKSDKKYLGFETVLKHDESGEAPVGPLFWAHYSYLGLNPKNLKDQYADYWKLNVNHAKMHYQYCVNNPKNYKGYGKDCWGLTASYSIKWYEAHSPNRDLGVISPTAALSSFPYTPEESMQFLRFIYQKADTLVGKYGPYDAFSLQSNWVTPRYLAIDQGPIPVMIENYRTGLLWDLFMSAPEVQTGLTKLEFQYN